MQSNEGEENIQSFEFCILNLKKNFAAIEFFFKNVTDIF